jgi:hypothetical protein
MSSPEPMTLGSPATSPTATNQYLPSFLLGDMQQFSSQSQVEKKKSNLYIY